MKYELDIDNLTLDGEEMQAGDILLLLEQFYYKKAPHDEHLMKVISTWAYGRPEVQEAFRTAEKRIRVSMKDGTTWEIPVSRIADMRAKYYADLDSKRGEGKPESFNFLGFTHICGKTKKGKFTVLRQTMRKKWQAKMKELYLELRSRMHDSVPKQGAYLRSVVAGHIRYYGVPTNSTAIGAFRKKVCRLWHKVLKRRSDKHRLPWERMKRLIAKYIPAARICHPYPSERLCVNT